MKLSETNKEKGPLEERAFPPRRPDSDRPKPPPKPQPQPSKDGSGGKDKKK